jgi:hypothetical protein
MNQKQGVLHASSWTASGLVAVQLFTDTAGITEYGAANGQVMGLPPDVSQ